jgi:hypothetical protein
MLVISWRVCLRQVSRSTVSVIHYEIGHIDVIIKAQSVQKAIQGKKKDPELREHG